MPHQHSEPNHKLRRRTRKEEYFFNHGYWPEDRTKYKVAKDYVSQTSFRDYILDESVCTVTSAEVLDFCVEIFSDEPFPQYISDKFERAIITYDSRGRGAFQK